MIIISQAICFLFQWKYIPLTGFVLNYTIFLGDIDEIVRHPMMPPKSSRQTLMFSATFPDEIQNAAKTYLREDYLFLGVGLVGGACADVSQVILEVEAFDKREKLVEILETGDKMDKTIVFVEKKQQADFLASFLSQNEVIYTIA